MGVMGVEKGRKIVIPLAESVSSSLIIIISDRDFFCGHITYIKIYIVLSNCPREQSRHKFFLKVTTKADVASVMHSWNINNIFSLLKCFLFLSSPMESYDKRKNKYFEEKSRKHFQLRDTTMKEKECQK